MSLATNAALFNEDFTLFGLSSSSSVPSSSSSSSSLSHAPERRRSRSQTQKIYPKENFDSKKVNSVLERIHSKNIADDDDAAEESGEEDMYFRPPPPPQSMGGTRKAREQQKTMMLSSPGSPEAMTTLGGVPKPTYIEKQNLDGNSYTSNYADDKTREDYYRSVLPGYTSAPTAAKGRFEQYASTAGANAAAPGDLLTQKINYMIHLLEEQQDQKTGSITEEVVLYSFLGIFIIFIADSFVRVGKYGKYIR